MLDPVYIMNKIASIVDPENDLTIEQIVKKIEDKFSSKNTVESNKICDYCRTKGSVNCESCSIYYPGRTTFFKGYKVVLI